MQSATLGRGAGSMASRSLNLASIEQLGVRRLAELLLELGSGDPAVRRRLRLELAGIAGTDSVARTIERRLSTIARARSFLARDKVRTLLPDLSAQHRAIVEQVGPADAVGALALLWRFMALAGSVLERCDDGNGRMIAVFQAAARDLGGLATCADADPLGLADRAFAALQDNTHGQHDELVGIIAAPLGAPGLQRLRDLLTAWADEWPAVPEGAPDIRRSIVRRALRQVADALGDVDAYIAQHSERSRELPAVAAGIGRRLLEAGRAADALAALDAARPDGPPPPLVWERVRLETLLALGRRQEAQAFRWERFLATLSSEHLRAHLATLPAFDAFDVEAQALAHAIACPDLHRALAFLVEWPELEQAGRLVQERQAELDGNLYEILTPAAAALERGQPRAATLLYRAMIDDMLLHARSGRYRHGVRHLHACARLSADPGCDGAAEDHAAYLARLRTAHGRETASWGLR